MPLCPRPHITTALVTLLVGACGGEAAGPSPLALWNIRPGMSLAELDSVAGANEGKRHLCVSAEAGFRRCTMATEAIYGEMEAVVDTADRVVMITFRPDFESMRGFEDMRGSVYLHAGMLSDAWSTVAERTDGTAADGTETSTWLTPDGRWRARIVGPWSKLDAMSVTDVAGAAPYEKALARGEEPQMPTHTADRVAQGPDPLRLLRYELRRLVDEQRGHHAEASRYAGSLDELGFLPRSGVAIEIGGADDSGWWARGTLRASRPCYVWIGAAPRVPGEPPLEGPAGEPLCRGVTAPPPPDLRAATLDLMTAQELHYAMHGYAYAQSPSRLDHEVPEGVTVEIRYASQLGWAGRLADARDTARSCAVVMGEVPPEVVAKLGDRVVTGRPFCGP